MATAVVSARVDETIRQKADAIMRKAGLTPSDVIQGVWSAMAQTGEIPEIARPVRDDAKGRTAMERLESFLGGLPPVNPAYAGLSDDEILATMVSDYA